MKDNHVPLETSVKKMPTTLSLDESELPEIKDWKVGGTYKIMLEVEQISSSKGEEYGMDDKDKKMRARFKIISAHAPMDMKDEASSHEEEMNPKSKNISEAARRKMMSY